MKKKILLIGSNGFIGRSLSKYLRKEYVVFNLNRKISKKNSKNISCDITNLDQLRKKISKLPEFEYVLNLSGQVHDLKSLMHKTIYIGNKNIINCFKKTQSIIVFFSTTLVYGHSKNYRSEKSKPKPISDYARIKLKTENLVEKFSNNFLILRIGNVYDKKLTKKGFLNNLLNAVKNNKILKVNKIESVRNYIHIYDLIRIIKMIIDKKLFNLTLNIGHQNVSNKKMITIFSKIYKKKIKINNLSKSYFLDPNIKLNKNFIVKKLNYKFKNNIENTIKSNK